MSEQDRTDGTPEPKKAPATNGAFLAIGFVFLILGISQMSNDNGGGGIAFLGVGVTFMALAGASRGTSGTASGTPAPDADGPDASSDGAPGAPDRG